MITECPVCRATQIAPPTCRRCKADLALCDRTRESWKRRACDDLRAGRFGRAFAAYVEATMKVEPEA